VRARKKPVEIEFIRWTGENYEELQDFLKSDLECVHLDRAVSIRTLEGFIHVCAGDYIIRGVHGEHYPCKLDIFEKTYDILD